MANKKIVIALGGNALGSTPEQQLELVKSTAKPIVDLIESGNSVVIAHGNGPQVGMINLGFEASAASGAIKSNMPFPECGAMSQGYIGYHLQNSIDNELASRGIRKDVVTLITQVVVDENDPAFEHPTKPIGMFYDEAEAKLLSASKGYAMTEDAGRGFRRVVASPKPVDVVEKDVIRKLVESGVVTITVGGGGIPVVKRNGALYGVPAVIDKDYASAKLAELIGADLLIILTAVEQVAINWGKPEQCFLADMSIEDCKRYCLEGQFAPGSMLPKVQAAMEFVQAGGCAVISSLERAADALAGKAGTVIHQ